MLADEDLVDQDLLEDLPEALGFVVTDGRGSLPYLLIHGEALVAAAAWALSQSGITPVDPDTAWSDLAESQEPVLLHDALCPMVPPAFLAACLVDAVARDHVVVGVRPVTDTVKAVRGGFVEETIDRADLVRVASPIVLPAAVVASLDALPEGDFAAVTAALRRRYPVVFRVVPTEGRRVESQDDVLVLEALTRPWLVSFSG